MAADPDDAELIAFAPEKVARAVPADAVLRVAEDAYGLGPLAEMGDLGGAFNLNLLVRSPAGAHVLRVHRPWVTSDWVATLHRAKGLLAQSGIPVCQPIRTRAGEAMLVVDGRVVEVEPFVAHDARADTWPRDVRAFAMLARLHDAFAQDGLGLFVPPRVSNYGTPLQLERWLAKTERLVLGRLEEDERRRGLEAERALSICRATRDVLGWFGAWWETVGEQLPRLLTHGDYGGGNVLFQNDQVIAILDFDFLDFRERVFDLAYSLYWALVRGAPDVPFEWISWTSAAAALAAYDATTEYPLTESEWRALPAEMVRVPLYWVATACFSGDSIGEVVRMAAGVDRARWLADHQAHVADELRRA
ncbi:MAG: phosphotransferase [Chloroflexi bacterium]|nr:phosphotransferase [Chloroflexota bacterium]